MDVSQIPQSSYDDEGIPQTLLQNLNEARKIGNNCDFTLKTEDGTYIHVHKIVLISVSSFFENMFNSGMRETRQYSLLLQKISGENLHRLVEYMYTGKIQINKSNIKEILDNALFLDLKDLIEYCTNILIDSITKDNIFELLQYGKQLIADDLSNACLKLMLNHIELFKHTEQFGKLSYEDIRKLILQDDRNYDFYEDVHLSAILKWIKFDLDARKKYLKELTEYLKFDKMSNKYLTSDELLKTASSLNETEFFTKILKCSRGNQLIEDETRKKYPNFYAITCTSIHNFDCKLIPSKTLKTNLTTKKYCFGCVGYKKQNIVMFGGYDSSSMNYSVYCSEMYSIERDKWVKLRFNVSGGWQAITIDDKIYTYENDSMWHLSVFDIAQDKWYTRRKTFSLPIDEITSICAKDNCIYCFSTKCLYCQDIREGKWLVKWSDFSESSVVSNEMLSYGNYLYNFNLDGYCMFDIRTKRWFNDFGATRHYQRNVIKRKEYPFSFETLAVASSRSTAPRPCLLNDEIYLYRGDNVQVYKAADLSFCRKFSISYLKKEDSLQHLISLQ